MTPFAKKVTLSVAQKYGLTFEEITSKRRHFRFSHARQEVFAILHPHYSLPKIGSFFELDHTTILHGIEQFERRQMREHTTNLTPVIIPPPQRRTITKIKAKFT